MLNRSPNSPTHCSVQPQAQSRQPQHQPNCGSPKPSKTQPMCSHPRQKQPLPPQNPATAPLSRRANPRIRQITIRHRRRNGVNVPIIRIPCVSSIRRVPSFVVKRANLRLHLAILEQEVRVDELAGLGDAVGEVEVGFCGAGRCAAGWVEGGAVVEGLGVLVRDLRGFHWGLAM